MTSSDSWLSHYSFRLRNMTQDSSEEGLDRSFRRMAQKLVTQKTITFQVQLLDGETSQSWCLSQGHLRRCPDHRGLYVWGRKLHHLAGGVPTAADSLEVSFLREALTKICQSISSMMRFLLSLTNYLCIHTDQNVNSLRTFRELCCLIGTDTSGSRLHTGESHDYFSRSECLYVCTTCLKFVFLTSQRLLLRLEVQL